MKRMLLVSVFFLAAASTCSAATAATSLTSTLPSGSHVLTSASIPGRDAVAIAYVDKGPRLGVVSSVGSHQLLWSRGLEAKPEAIQVPGEAGVFRAVLTNQSGDHILFAYELRGTKVVSAIAGHPDGHLAATEAIHTSRAGFELWSRDTAHVGSVPYRNVLKYRWTGGKFIGVISFREPDYAAGQEPVPNGIVRTRQGNVILMKLEVAATALQQEQGLMYRKSLDPDSGMVFVWQWTQQGSFWMENTYIPLSIAFLAPDGTIQEIQDMAPLDPTLHTPAEAYQYAIEVNQGFFSQNGIGVGDRVQLHLGS